MVTILAIDPGNEQSAYCIMDENYKLIEFDKRSNAEVLSRMSRGAQFETYDDVVIERVASYGLAVGREVFETCEWIGRFTQQAEDYRIPVHYIYRKDEKVNLCGSMKAKDTNIRQALIDRFAKHDLKSGRGTKANPDYFYGVRADIWAAIAVATTYLDMQKENGNV